MMKYFIHTLMMAAFLAGSLSAAESAVDGDSPRSDSLRINTVEIMPLLVPLQEDSVSRTGRTRVPKKSLKKAFFMSLVLPGAGEYYAGAKTQAKAFLGAEALIWSFAAFNKFQGEMWKRDYRNFAAQQAGANPEQTEDIYYQNVYEYPSSYWYNEDLWAEARMIYPDDPQAQETYVIGLLYGSPDDWAWQTQSDWYQYRGLRVRSQEALHRISYSYGAAILNHLLSAVNAARLTKRYNKNRLKRAELKESWQLRFLTTRSCDIGLALGKGF